MHSYAFGFVLPLVVLLPLASARPSAVTAPVAAIGAAAVAQPAPIPGPMPATTRQDIPYWSFLPGPPWFMPFPNQ